jgi:predicted porin
MLDSHTASASLRHTFSARLEGELSDTYQVSRNPESLLPGLSTVLNTDQSYTLNQLDGRLAAKLTKRAGLTLKARTAAFGYDNESLAEELDRDEYIVGLATTYALLPEIQAVAEYRHQTIRYASDAATKDKDSDFVLAGADYVLNARTALSGRIGAEYRRRKGAEDEAMPYAELAAKTDYAKGSYISVGYGFSVEEVSNLDVYTDMSVHRFFANVQHALTPKSAATASVSWEPSKLNGREGISPDRDETNIRAGVAFVYRISPRWTVSATLDRDDITSDDPGRMLKRTRGGVSVRAVF